MEKLIYGYEKPEIEIIEISVEKGFNGSEPVDPGGEIIPPSGDEL
jgi:hypothetical protein